jgi:hypothetical protein
MTNEPPRIVYAPIVNRDDSVSLAAAGSEADTNKDATLVDLPLLPVLTSPTQDLHSPFSKLFQCSLVSEKNNFVMYYEHPDGTKIPVLRADKQKTFRNLPKYYVYDISRTEGGDVVPLNKESTEYLGKLRREKDLRIHSFALHSQREQDALSRKVMQLLFDVPLASSFRNKPRKAQVALYHEASDTSERGNTLSERVVSSMKETSFLDHVADPHAGLWTFVNKKPSKDKNGDFALNFFGRCTHSNPANMQMEDDQGRVMLQFAANEESFSLDFRAPFTAFTAFGFAITQLIEY